MMLTLIALVQSALACGPYFPAASSEDGAFAFSDENNQIVLYTADKEQRIELPIFGDVIDMDFVGSELVVAFEDKDGSFLLLFDEDGEDIAEWSPRRSSTRVGHVRVLDQGLVVGAMAGDRRVHIRLTDDLDPQRAIGDRIARLR